MTKCIRKLFTVALALMLVLSLSLNAFAAADLTAGGENWIWDEETLTLTLNGAAISENITLPDGSTIVVNGDGTWTVFPDLGLEVVKIAFHRWNDELDAYENWRTVEVFKGVNFLNPAHDNALNYSHPIYRFKDGDLDGIADGLAELNVAAGSVERPFTYWTDAPDGNGDEVLTNETVIEGDMNVYVAFKIVPEVPAAPQHYTLTFDAGTVSHLCYLYVDKTTGEVIYDYKIDFSSGDTSADIPVKDGFVTAIFMKQAKSGIIWTSEEVSEEVMDDIIASVIANDRAYKGHDAEAYGEGAHDLTYAIGNGKKGKTKTVTYTFLPVAMDNP